MMRTAIASAAVLTVFAFPAAAQDAWDEPILDAEQQVGTRFLIEPETADASEARYLQKRVANCVWNRHEDEVRAMLVASDYDTIDYQTLGITPDSFGDDFDIGYCIGRAMTGRYRHLGMRYQLSTMRNLLAEEAYLSDFDGPPEVVEGQERRMPDRFPDRRPFGRTLAMAEIGDCIVYNAPTQVHAFLSARPGSDRETEAVESIAPTFGTCAPSDSDEISISTSMLRQMTADAIWARSHFGQGAPRAAVSFQPDEETAAANDRTLEQEVALCLIDSDPGLAAEVLAATQQDAFFAAMERVAAICPLQGRISSQELQTAIRAGLGEEPES